MPRRLPLLAALLLAPLAAAGADDLGYRESGDLAIQARGVLRKYCGECHGDAPAAGRASVTDHAALLGNPGPVAFVSRSKKDSSKRSQVVEFMEDGSMPPGGRERPTDPEIAAVRRWIAAADAAAYPKAFDDATALAAVLADLDRVPAEDRANARYVSFAHLAEGADGPAALLKGEKALYTALTAAADAPPKLVPVDPCATVFRYDIGPAGWGTPDLFDRVKADAGTDKHRMVPFDLVLLEMPPPGKLPDDAAAALKPLDQLRPVPFVRGDWLATALRAGGRPTPLAADLLALSKLAKAKDGETVDGPPPRPFAGERAPAAAFGSWTATDAAANPPPFALTASVVSAEDEPREVDSVRVSDRFRLRVACDRDVRLTLVTVREGGEAAAAQLADGRQLKVKEPRRLAPSGDDAFTVASIPRAKDAITLRYVLFASDAAVPPPVIVRSTHGTNPVWRIVPPPEMTAANTVRKVLAVTVTRD